MSSGPNRLGEGRACRASKQMKLTAYRAPSGRRHRGRSLGSEFTNDFMIARLAALDMAQIEPIVSESQREGFGFLVRLRDERMSGANRFSMPGETLFGVFISGYLVGVGGINRQNDCTGRLRRFYILPSNRRRGYGRSLLHHILSHAVTHFRFVVLHTTTESGDRFYRACGFMRIPDSSDPTHRIELPEAEQDAPPNSRPPSAALVTPEDRSSDSLRTPLSGGGG
jgi:N-acetylglutamate synthase-like GNAT family acetyltransferase